MSTATRWVASPVTLVAAMALLVNDHVLKPLWPGFVTGKLSDVAGLAAAPALLGLALGITAPKLAPRLVVWTSLGAVGVAFGWVKTTEHGAAAASAAWSVVAGPSQVLRDPTDLVALPALAISWWAWRRAVDQESPSDAALRRVRMSVGLPLLLLAVTATSAVPDPARGDGRGAARRRCDRRREQHLAAAQRDRGRWVASVDPGGGGG